MPQTERATAGDNPTQDDVTAAAVENGEAFFASGTDPAVAPVAAHREAHAEGGEYADTGTPEDAGNVPTTDVPDETVSNSVEVGGQTMTQAQYDAAVASPRGTDAETVPPSATVPVTE